MLKYRKETLQLYFSVENKIIIKKNIYITKNYNYITIPPEPPKNGSWCHINHKKLPTIPDMAKNQQNHTKPNKNHYYVQLNPGKQTPTTGPVTAKTSENPPKPIKNHLKENTKTQEVHLLINILHLNIITHLHTRL